MSTITGKTYSQLPVLTSGTLDLNDYVPVVDYSDGSNSTKNKRASLQSVFQFLSASNIVQVPKWDNIVYVDAEYLTLRAAGLKAYATVSDAYSYVLTQTPSPSNQFVLSLGIGSFGNFGNSAWSPNVYIVGMGPDVSKIGNVAPFSDTAVYLLGQGFSCGNVSTLSQGTNPPIVISGNNIVVNGYVKALGDNGADGTNGNNSVEDEYTCITCATSATDAANGYNGSDIIIHGAIVNGVVESIGGDGGRGGWAGQNLDSLCPYNCVNDMTAGNGGSGGNAANITISNSILTSTVSALGGNGSVGGDYGINAVVDGSAGNGGNITITNSALVSTSTLAGTPSAGNGHTDGSYGTDGIVSINGTTLIQKSLFLPAVDSTSSYLDSAIKLGARPFLSDISTIPDNIGIVEFDGTNFRFSTKNGSFTPTLT